jgi:hypothetical protein
MAIESRNRSKSLGSRSKAPHGVEHGREHRVVNVVAEVATGQLRI